MQIPPIPQPSQENSLLVSTKNVPALQVGDIVQAEVLTVTETAVAIRMKSTILEARTNLPLREGEVLSLLVEEAGSQIRLRMLRGNGDDSVSLKNTILSALGALKELKPAADDLKVLRSLIGTMPEALKEKLPGLPILERMMVSLEGLSGNVLKNAVRDSGALFEAKLRLFVMGEGSDESEPGPALSGLVQRDTKAALLGLKLALESPVVQGQLAQGGVKGEVLTAAVENMLKHIEFLQLQSRLTDTLQLFVPFAWKDLKEGELIFRQSEREQRGEESSTCTVNLDLERVGKMSARIQYQYKRIYIDVMVENARFSDLLQDKAAILQGQLEAAGINLGGLSIRHDTRIDIDPSHAGRLNVRV
jgi:hypothetical protein